MVIDGETAPVEGGPSAEPARPPVTDFSDLQGFQFVGVREGETVSDEAWRTALALELDTRTARFHQAVDSSIVLASDGTIRWLGDPVAKLAAGDDLLAPRPILLVDEAMSPEARTTVAARLDLWLKAMIERLLGPLFALRALQEGSDQLQGLALKIAEALGILERETVRGVVKGLDQTSRAVLRRQGVRFGSYYLYVPSTLRPASRALALQLWCLKKGDEQLNAAAQSLMPMASSGRTSAPCDPRVTRDTYRVGGFRACGDRVVRVDIVERLADMIRAASTLRVVAGPTSGSTVFQVASQMTSLTGCSGDGFGSILRGLGFESVTVKRSEIAFPAPATPAAAPVEATAPDAVATAAEAAAEEAGSLAEASEAATEEADVSAEAPEAAAEDAAAPADDHASEPVARALETEAGPSEDAAVPRVGGEEAAAPIADADEAALPPDDVQLEADAGGTVAEAEAETKAVASAEGEPAQDLIPSAEEPVTVWRFVRPPVAHHRRPRPARRPHEAKVPRAAEREGAKEAAEVSAGGPEAAKADDARGQERPVAKPFSGRKPGKKAWDADKPKRAREDWNKGRPAPSHGTGGDRRPALDPTSPFAKLMELRAILESESKKRN